MRLGVEVHRRRDPLRFLTRMGIRTVLDIGANEGQFARKVRELLPSARIYSFEPLASPFGRLRDSFAQDQNFNAIQLALGAEPGEAEFHSNDFTPSSSFLPSTERLRMNFPHASETKKSKITVSTLDLWANTQELEPKILVKIDVQGFEDHVIRGGSETLARAAVVIAETSFAALYEGQALYDDVYQLLRSLGFRSAGMIDNVCDADTGEVLQADSIFVRDPVNKLPAEPTPDLARNRRDGTEDRLHFPDDPPI